MATAKKAPAAAKRKSANTKISKTTAKKPKVRAATAKKATAQKVAGKKSQAAIAKKATVSPLTRLKSINLSAALTNLLFALLVIIFVSPASAELLLSHQARDAFANLDGVALGSASEVLVNVEYRYMLVAVLLVGAIGSLLIATKLRKTYEKGVSAGISGLRWIFMGISAALTLEFVSFIGGVQDIATLKLVAGLIVVTALLGWLSERENASSKSPKWLAFGSSIFTGYLAWLPLIGSLVGTGVYGGERFGWHVYVLAGVTLAGFIGFAVTQYSSIKKKSLLEYTIFENRYLRIDQLTKFLIVLVTIAALQK